jgi:hypothetical protein
MLTALQAAAVVAAIAFAAAAAAGVYALVRLARLISAATGVVTDFRVRSDLLVGRANSAVDRAHEQLARTDAITANMDEVSANIAELTADVSMLSGAVHTLLGGPLGRLAAFSFGVRRAIALRRGDIEAERLPRMRHRLMRGDSAALPAARLTVPGAEGQRRQDAQTRPPHQGRRARRGRAPK